ncbi:MAG: NAD(P)-dependent oxidoreductase [Microscillaceae bacterium]
MKIALIREGKTPPDQRVALVPAQCQHLQAHFPPLEIWVQPSPHRAIPDQEYEAAGVSVREDIAGAEVFFGVKEVPVEALIPEKTYLFFSHTIKKQPYNRDLLRAILQKNIRLIDYECLVDGHGQRVVAFGRYAGLVGAYNGLRAYGKRSGRFDLKPAHQCFDVQELYAALQEVSLPPIRVALTGTGRAGKGAEELLLRAGLTTVRPMDLVRHQFHEAVYAVLRSEDYYQLKPGFSHYPGQFYEHPERFTSHFDTFYPHIDLLITAHYWHPRAAALFSKAQAAQPDFAPRVIADITCDVEGSVPINLQTSTIAEPFYDYDPVEEKIKPPFSGDRHITLMTIDNLPSELPRDASTAFGAQLLKHVFPALLGPHTEILERATIAQNGQLCPRFAYLADYVA